MKKISGDMKGFLIFLSAIVTIILVAILVICFPKWGCGIFFPKYVYIFEQHEYERYTRYNFINHLVFKNELSMSIEPGNFSNDCEIWTGIFTDKPYNMLHIKQLSCYYEEHEALLFSDIDVKLPEKVKRIEKIANYYGHFSTWITDGDKRYVVGLYNYQMPIIKISKILKNKKIGEEFPFQLRIKYSFDNGEEKNCELHYDVKIVKRVLPYLIPIPTLVQSYR